MEYKVIKSKIAHGIFALAAAVLCISGIIDGYDGTPSMLFFYTYLSNIFLFCIFISEFIIELVNIIKKTNYELPAGLKGFATIAILFTFLTVFFVLNPFSLPSDWLDARIHYVVPILGVLDWALFATHCRFRLYHPFCWVFAPIVYFAYVLLAAICGMKYYGTDYFPYFFMDVVNYGWGFVLSMLLMLAGIFIVFGYILVGFDNIPKIKAKLSAKK